MINDHQFYEDGNVDAFRSSKLLVEEITRPGGTNLIFLSKLKVLSSDTCICFQKS